MNLMSDKKNGARRSGRPMTADDPNAQIAAKLRALYISVQEETIPDRFMDLLEKLDAAEQQSQQRNSGGVA